jgi:hypothetical protein
VDSVAIRSRGIAVFASGNSSNRKYPAIGADFRDRNAAAMIIDAQHDIRVNEWPVPRGTVEDHSFDGSTRLGGMAGEQTETAQDSGHHQETPNAA